MAVLCAAAECRVTAKKEESTAVKLKAFRLTSGCLKVYLPYSDKVRSISRDVARRRVSTYTATVVLLTEATRPTALCSLACSVPYCPISTVYYRHHSALQQQQPASRPCNSNHQQCSSLACDLCVGSTRAAGTITHAGFGHAVTDLCAAAAAPPPPTIL